MSMIDNGPDFNQTQVIATHLVETIRKFDRKYPRPTECYINALLLVTAEIIKGTFETDEERNAPWQACLEFFPNHPALPKELRK